MIKFYFMVMIYEAYPSFSVLDFKNEENLKFS